MTDVGDKSPHPMAESFGFHRRNGRLSFHMPASRALAYPDAPREWPWPFVLPAFLLCYHMLLSGTDIRTVHFLLLHSSNETTTVHRHLLINRHGASPPSPLDLN